MKTIRRKEQFWWHPDGDGGGGHPPPGPVLKVWTRRALMLFPPIPSCWFSDFRLSLNTSFKKSWIPWVFSVDILRVVEESSCPLM